MGPWSHRTFGQGPKVRKAEKEFEDLRGISAIEGCEVSLGATRAQRADSSSASCPRALWEEWQQGRGRASKRRLGG
eukprot:1073838-Pyramimonas_sp.AAC.1